MYPSQTLSDSTRATRRNATVRVSTVGRVMTAAERQAFRSSSEKVISEYNAKRAARNCVGAVVPAGMYGVSK